MGKLLLIIGLSVVLISGCSNTQNNASNQNSNYTVDRPVEKVTFNDQKQVEQLIKSYFDALDRNDYAFAWELTSTEQKERYPEFEAIKSHWGIMSVKLISMKGYLSVTASSGYVSSVQEHIPTVHFEVTLDIKPEPQSAWNEGINERFVIVIKESDGKWKINGLATSP